MTSEGLQIRTCTFARHDNIDLECDIYTGPNSRPDLPVFLYFHPGGLVSWNRRHIPLWLIQACYQRGWSLVSAEYRLAPHTWGTELFEDAEAAALFARTLDVSEGKKRKLIIGGSSAGFFFGPVLARDRELEGSVLALLSICGIPSFQHDFFESSTLLTPKPIPLEAVKHHLDVPMKLGSTEPGNPAMFERNMLKFDGSKNENFVKDAGDITKETTESGEVERHTEGRPRRDMLYEYYVYTNAFRSIVYPIDSGFKTTDETLVYRQAFPPTVIIHGDADKSLPLEVSYWMRDGIQCDKVKVFVAKGKGHLFELGSFWEDEGEEMDVVREAFGALSDIVKRDTT